MKLAKTVESLGSAIAGISHKIDRLHAAIQQPIIPRVKVIPPTSSSSSQSPLSSDAEINTGEHLPNPKFVSVIRKLHGQLSS